MVSSFSSQNAYNKLYEINKVCSELNRMGDTGKILKMGDEKTSLIKFTDYANNVIKKCNENINSDYKLKDLVDIRRYCTNLIKQKEIEIQSYNKGIKWFLSLFIPNLFDGSKKKLQEISSKLKNLKHNIRDLQKNILSTRVSVVSSDEKYAKQEVYFNDLVKTKMYAIGSPQSSEGNEIALKTREISNKQSGLRIQVLKNPTPEELREKIHNGYIVDSADIENAFKDLCRRERMSSNQLESILSLFNEKLNLVLDRLENREIESPEVAYDILWEEFDKGLQFFQQSGKSGISGTTDYDPGTPNYINESQTSFILQNLYELKDIVLNRFEHVEQ